VSPRGPADERVINAGNEHLEVKKPTVIGWQGTGAVQHSADWRGLRAAASSKPGYRPSTVDQCVCVCVRTLESEQAASELGQSTGIMQWERDGWPESVAARIRHSTDAKCLTQWKLCLWVGRRLAARSVLFGPPWA